MAEKLEWNKDHAILQDQEIFINPIHGFIYQLKLLMLFLYRGLSCKYSFRIGTEIKAAKKFDDLVFEYVEDNKKIYRLLQAKHKFHEYKKITVDKLLEEPKGDYSLIKYFYSFQACIEDKFFGDGIIKDVIICTNIDFDFDDLKNSDIELEKLSEKDNILDIKMDEKEPTRYKFTNSIVKKLRSKLKPKVSESDIEYFLNHLIFAVNQPNEDELGQLIIKEIGREMSFVDSENAYNKLFSKMINLSLGKEKSRFLSHEEGKKFFDDLKMDISIWFNIQDPISSFTGRFEYLKIIHEILTNNRHACISGIGGVGKTELVRKYISDYGHEYDNQIVWINAESYRTAADSFRQLASDKLNISLKTYDGKDKHINSVITDVYQFLSQRKSLFIFDNAEKYKCETEFDCGIQQFLPCLPSNFIKPNVIITSRNQKWPKSITTIKLDPLKADEARELVVKSLTLESDKEKEQVDEMCGKMQFLPLALQQAVAYIKMQKEQLECIGSDFEIRNYLEKYAKMTHELLDFKFSEDSDSNYDKTVLTTWNITLDTLKDKENGHDTLNILNNISYFLPENIPIELLKIFVKDEQKLISAIGLLRQYSIVTVQHKVLSIHRLVQQVVRIKLQQQNNEIGILENIFKPLDTDNINYKNIDHIISAWMFAKKYSQLLGEYSHLSSLIIANLLECGRYDEAMSIGKEVSTLLKAHPHYKHASCTLFRLKNYVALCTLRKGEYQKALEELREVYAIQKQNLSPSNLNSMLTTKMNIAFAFLELGLNRDSLQSHLEVLKECKINNFEESHHIVLSAKQNISSLLFIEGKHAEALLMMKEVYDTQKKTLGDHHIQTLHSRKEIAVYYGKINKIDKSLKLLVKICSDFEAILPINHPTILATKFSIAHNLEAQKKYDPALKMYRELFDIKTKTYGQNYPRAIKVNIRIAEIMKKQRKYEKALEIFQDVFEKQKITLGLTHPDIFVTQSEIACLLLEQKRYADVIDICTELLDKQKHFSVHNHMDTLITLRSMVVAFSELKQYDAALKCSLEALEISEKLPELRDDAAIFADRNNVGMMYFYTGNLDKALDILTELLVTQEKLLGKDHADCQSTRNNIMGVIVDRKKFCEDEINHRRAVSSDEFSKKSIIIQSKYAQGPSMLHHASKNRQEREVEHFLLQAAEIFVVNNKGHTPLHVETSKGQEKMVNLLLKKLKPERLNDFVDAKTTSSGSTALHIAAKLGHFGIVKCLLKNHATFCVTNKDGKMPVDLSNNANVTSFLKTVHELFENVKQDGATVVKKLMLLSSEEFLSVANTRNDRGSTLVQVAMLNKQNDVAAQILKMIQKWNAK